MPLLRSRSSVLFLAIVGLAGTWAALTIRFETELLPILPRDLPSVRGLEAFSRLAAGETEVFAVADPSLPAAEQQQLLDQARAAWSVVPAVSSVTSPGENISSEAGTLAAWTLLSAEPSAFACTTSANAPPETNTALSFLSFATSASASSTGAV